MPLQRTAEALAPVPSEIAIGHDIIALISSAMYTEPLTVYRELCQNSADAIDAAVGQGLVNSGRVDVTIDPLHRSIIVRDNGEGVPNAEFTRRMCALGASKKRGTGARGFRGIGRLVGLGYCQELVFRSRSVGDARVFEATWDCRTLREALRTPAYTSLVDVISRVVKVTSRRADREDLPNFFEVELRKVVRLANDGLLNASAVTDYLSEVAPVPFAHSFSAGASIAAFLQRHGVEGNLAIHVNGSPERISRPYRDVLPVSSSKSATLHAPTFFEIPSDDGQLAAVGWVAHHGYFGAFPRHLGVRGLRARVGNLQIGEDDCLEDVFTESRFNAWTVGEVHVLDQRVVANGRRDSFEPNLAFENLSNHLVEQAQSIVRLCRSFSASRRKERSLTDLEKALASYGKLLKKNRVARMLREELLDDVNAQIERTRRKLSVGEQHDALARLEAQIHSLETVGKLGDGRPTQRQTGQADVLKLLRENIPGGTATSVALLKLLEAGES